MRIGGRNRVSLHRSRLMGIGSDFSGRTKDLSVNGKPLSNGRDHYSTKEIEYVIILSCQPNPSTGINMSFSRHQVYNEITMMHYSFFENWNFIALL